jgi:thymidine kinase
MSKLYFRYAAMNAGKSTQLLQIEYNYRTLGRQAQLLTAKVDNRFGSGVITSRLGISSPAAMYSPQTDMYAVVKAYRESVTDDTIGAILIDEAQFLRGEQVRDLHRACHDLGVPVICFGIRSDFQGNPFEGSAMLLTLAEDIEELKNVCSCGAKATMNLRVDAQGNRIRSGPQVLIGDATYRPVCAACFYG